MFPDNNHEVESPKFFTLTLTDAYGVHTYLYNLKFSETYALDQQTKIKVPLVISIRSNKEDMEPFKEILYAIHQIIVNTDNNDKEFSGDVINNYKKIELLNLFTFCFSLIKPPPHSLLKLKLDSLLYNDTIEDLSLYFCSYCEIPCNKNDQDINMLFSILDHSIIVKLIFSILTEKQIIIRASQAYVLHLIFPALLKLIFPFQWIHSYLPVLPSEQLELLEKPGSYLFGVLSSSISLDGILCDYPGRVVVDCDTNEIFDSEMYYPPKGGEGLVQGKNTIIVEREKIYVLDGVKKKLSLKSNDLNKGNIIVDCATDTLYIDKSSSYLTVDEWQRIKRKIQFIKNPETFSFENIGKAKKNNKGGDDIFEILPNRSFSYNIQNVFLNLFLEKMLYEKSEFMQSFMQTNLYKIYQDPQKYQNDAGLVIVDNIKNTSDNPRSFLNSLEIQMYMQNFPAKKILEEMKEDNTMELNCNTIILNDNKEEDKKIEKEVKKVLNDFCKVKGFMDDFPVEKMPSSNRLTTVVMTTNKKNQGRNSNASNNMNFNNRERHIKNNTSLLAQSVGNKAMFLMEKTDENNEFLFYNDKGFIQFMKNFFSFLDRKHIDLCSTIYNEKLVNEVIKLLRNETDLLPNEGEVENVIKQNLFPNEKTNEIYRISEKDENNDNDSCGSVRVLKNVSGNLNLDGVMEDTLLSFSNLYEDKNDPKYINHYLQLYLFIAAFLEEVKEDKHLLVYFNNEVNDDVNINEIIFNLYQNAFEIGNKRDFPYYTYYSFIESLSYDEIDLLTPKEKNKELLEIFNKVFDKKEEKESKKRPLRNHSDTYHYKRHKTNSIGSTGKLSTMSSGTPTNTNVIPFSIVVENTSEPTIPSGVIKNTIIQTEPIVLPKVNVNLNKKIVINAAEEFVPIGEPLSWNIIKEFSQLIGFTLPSVEDIANKTPQQIIDETNLKINNRAIIELVSELKKINLKKIEKPKQRVAFWVNCFNYLCLFAIFYKRLFINTEKDWRNFMKNVYYNIGGIEFSFNDMQYILFDKIIFFDTSYRAPQNLKEFSVLASKNKYDKGEDIELSYFSLYLPTKELLGPQVVSEDDCDCYMPFRTTNYFTSFVRMENKKLILPAFVTMVEPKFLKEGLAKYKNCLDSQLYDIIDKRKYKETVKRKISWELNFEYLLKQKEVAIE